MRRLQDLSSQHAAIVILAKRARSGRMEIVRALALIEAVIDGHAVPQWDRTLDPNKSRLTIIASEDGCPPDVRALLEHAQTPTPTDPAERSMFELVKGGAR